jgi:Ca2+-binding RTX toxin-like protein
VGTGQDENYGYSASRSPEFIDADGGDDTIIGGERGNVLYGGEGTDSIVGGAGNDYIDGGVGNDFISAGGGNDTIYGGGGNDTINAGGGDDIIWGGGGNNLITGGNGADTFAWKHSTDLLGHDSIQDFTISTNQTTQDDKLSFKDLLETGETLDHFLADHVSVRGAGLGLDTVSHTLNFTINDGAFSKDVSVTFDTNDSGYVALVSNYNDASDQSSQDQVLFNFLTSISNIS